MNENKRVLLKVKGFERGKQVTATHRGIFAWKEIEALTNAATGRETTLACSELFGTSSSFVVREIHIGFKPYAAY